MTQPVRCRHRITVDAPLAQTFMLFTPAGEELWVDGWRPSYRYPPDGRTVEGMVFTTGAGDEFTVWTLLDFDTGAHRSRYLRCTPASRLTLVEIACRAAAGRTEVHVTYTLTALNDAAEATVASFADSFAAMIDGWATQIAARLERLRAAAIR